MAHYTCQSVSSRREMPRHSVATHRNSRRDAEIWAKNCNVEGGAHVLWEHANDGTISEAILFDGNWRWKRNPLFVIEETDASFEECYDWDEEEGLDHFYWGEMDDMMMEDTGCATCPAYEGIET